MNLHKAINRDRKRRNRSKMPVDGRSVLTIQEVLKRRSKQIKQEQAFKEKVVSGEL